MLGFNLSKEINERKVGALLREREERKASLKMCVERSCDPKPMGINSTTTWHQTWFVPS
jgi:hypothetical protein